MGLYSVQQQLARQQMLMEREADSHASLQQLRLAKEATLAQVREMYRSMLEQLRSEQQQSESQTAIGMYMYMYIILTVSVMPLTPPPSHSAAAAGRGRVSPAPLSWRRPPYGEG